MIKIRFRTACHSRRHGTHYSQPEEMWINPKFVISLYRWNLGKFTYIRLFGKDGEIAVEEDIETLLSLINGDSNKKE